MYLNGKTTTGTSFYSTVVLNDFSLLLLLRETKGNNIRSHQFNTGWGKEG